MTDTRIPCIMEPVKPGGRLPERSRRGATQASHRSRNFSNRVFARFQSAWGRRMSAPYRDLRGDALVTAKGLVGDRRFRVAPPSPDRSLQLSPQGLLVGRPPRVVQVGHNVKKSRKVFDKDNSQNTNRPRIHSIAVESFTCISE